MLHGQGQKPNGERSPGTRSVSVEWAQIKENLQLEFTDNAVDAAMSNSLVLREIFKNLIYEDLVSCCNVNSIWRATADPMICYYQIACEDSQSPPRWYKEDAKLIVEVVEIIGFTSIAQTSLMEIEELMNKLRKSNKKHLISIELRFCRMFYFYNRCYLPFLTEFGHRVHVLDCGSRESQFGIDSFPYNVHDFKNLQVLKLAGCDLACTHYEDQCIHEHGFVLPQLRRIYLGKTVPVQYWPDLLTLAPNVQELLEFPLQIMAFNRNVKVEAIKSLFYLKQWKEDPHDHKLDLDQISVSLENLAMRGPELCLKSLDIPNFYNLFPTKEWDRGNKKQIALIQKHFKCVLESSQDTIKIMTIPAAKGLYYFLPINFQMVSVETLKFENDSDLYEDGYPCISTGDCSYTKNTFSTTWTKKHHYFPKGTELLKMFPNLQALGIKFNLSRPTLMEFFPSDTFGAKLLGSSISSLKIKVVSLDGFEKLVKLFPSVTNLEMESTVEHFSTVFPTICKAWGELKSLKIFFDPSKSFHRHEYREYFSLDQIITGIPEDVCNEMHDHGMSSGQETTDKINKFQSERISFLHLRHLQLLEFIITGKSFVCYCGEKYEPNFISKLSATFAFQKMPHLTVYVSVIKGFAAFYELQHALSPLGNFIQFDNTYTIPREYD